MASYPCKPAVEEAKVAPTTASKAKPAVKKPVTKKKVSNEKDND